MSVCVLLVIELLLCGSSFVDPYISAKSWLILACKTMEEFKWYFFTQSHCIDWLRRPLSLDEYITQNIIENQLQ